MANIRGGSSGDDVLGLFAAVAQKADVEIGVLICTLGEPGESLASNPSSAGQAREALCIFKPKNGAEEVYAGKGPRR